MMELIMVTVLFDLMVVLGVIFMSSEITLEQIVDKIIELRNEKRIQNVMDYVNKFED